MRTFRARRTSLSLPAVLCLFVLTLTIWAGKEAAVAQGIVSTAGTNLPLVTIRQFLDDGRSWGETNVLRLQGVVTASLSDKTYFIQDADAGVYIFHRPDRRRRVGEWVEVTGHPSLGGLKPLLDGSAVRTLGERVVPGAAPVTFMEAMTGRYHMRLIRIRGRLSEERLRGGGHLVLNAGSSTNSFVADLEALSDYEAVSRIQPGSLLDLTGVCNLRTDATGNRLVSLTVFARSAADVVVVSGPPWWTGKRMRTMLGIALGGLSLALAWGWTLRRQVGRQTLHLRKELEKQMALEQRYRQLFQSNPHPMWVYDSESLRFLAVNEAAIHHYGYSRNEFLSMNSRHLSPHEEGPALAGGDAGGTQGSDGTGVRNHRKKDGLIIEVELKSHAIEFDGRPARVALALDVTERRRAEAALRRSEQYRRAIIDAEPECVKVVAADGTLLDMNAAGLSMVEAGSLADVAGSAIARFVRPEHQAAFADLHRRVLAGGSGVLQFEIEGLKGARRWLETHAVPLPGADNGGPALLAITRDITERKATEESLRRSEEERLRAFETLQLFIDSVPGYVSFVDTGQRYQLVNPSYEQWFGRKRRDIIGRRLDELHSATVYQEMQPLVERALHGELVQYENCVNDTAGEAHWFDIRYIPRQTLDGTVAGFFVLVLDVTAKKQAEAALRESRERLDNILSSLDDVVWSSSADSSRILFLSAAAATVYGRPKEDLYADPRLWLAMIHSEDREKITAAFEGLMNGQDAFDVEYRIVRPDGSVRWLRNRTRMARDGSGNPLRIDGLASDITTRKQAEVDRVNFDRQIQQTQKLESLGVLAGGIAHDFNNLLAAVMGNVSLAMVSLPQESPVREPLLEAENATQRAADLARQMLAYSGKGRFVIQQVQLASVVKEMMSMLQVSISKKAILHINFAEDQPAIEADVTQLRQIILNLVINASDAIAEPSGAVAISTGARECDQAYLKTTWLKDPLREGRYAYLEVADSGCGIAKEQLPKIFDPFFTTKFTGRGLGLAAVLGIVRGHKGAIKVQSEVGQGTTFTVLFPAAGAMPAAQPGDQTGEADWIGNGLVLLVDDEKSIRDVGMRMLQRIGFEVRVASDGRDALAQVREHGDQITVILLDLTMPHMDGEQTFRELQRIRTDIPVILSSGYSEQDVVERFAGKGIAGFVPKPYTISQLRSVLQLLLGNAERAPNTLPA